MGTEYPLKQVDVNEYSGHWHNIFVPLIDVLPNRFETRLWSCFFRNEKIKSVSVDGVWQARQAKSECRLTTYQRGALRADGGVFLVATMIPPIQEAWRSMSL